MILKTLVNLSVMSLLALSVSTGVQAQSARDYISIVGSSTVYPFATVVAEQFGKTTSFKTPKIESTVPAVGSNCSAPVSVSSIQISPMHPAE